MELNTEDFLWYSYFGITKTEAEKSRDKAMEKCIDRAYSDFKRTIDYRKSTSELKAAKTEEEKIDKEKFIREKEEFKSEKKEIIKNRINDIIRFGENNPTQNCENQKKYDQIHEQICNKICDNDVNIKKSEALKNSLTYGQAQKWVNMTIKYMAIMGFWNDELESVKMFLHVPLDSYILKAVFHKGTRDKINEKEKLIADENDWVHYDGAILPQTARFKGDYPKGEDGKMKPVAWSKISTYDDYMIIQKKIKKCIPEGYYPLVWENKVWLAFSKVKSGN